MQDFLLDNVPWVFMAVTSAAGLVWTFMRGGKLSLSPQAAILEVSRNGGVFLDIRPPAEYAEGGHIPRSQNIPAGELLSRLSAVAKFKKKPVVVVCQTGVSARKIRQQLEKNGFEQVRVLAGGISAWRDANLPLFGKKGGAKK